MDYTYIYQEVNNNANLNQQHLYITEHLCLYLGLMKHTVLKFYLDLFYDKRFVGECVV